MTRIVVGMFQHRPQKENIVFLKPLLNIIFAILVCNKLVNPLPSTDWHITSTKGKDGWFESDAVHVLKALHLRREVGSKSDAKLGHLAAKIKFHPLV